MDDGIGRVIRNLMTRSSTDSPVRIWLPGLGIASLALRDNDASIRYAVVIPITVECHHTLDGVKVIPPAGQSRTRRGGKDRYVQPSYGSKHQKCNAKRLRKLSTRLGKVVYDREDATITLTKPSE